MSELHDPWGGGKGRSHDLWKEGEEILEERGGDIT